MDINSLVNYPTLNSTCVPQLNLRLFCEAHSIGLDLDANTPPALPEFFNFRPLLTFQLLQSAKTPLAVIEIIVDGDLEARRLEH